MGGTVGAVAGGAEAGVAIAATVATGAGDAVVVGVAVVSVGSNMVRYNTKCKGPPP